MSETVMERPTATSAATPASAPMLRLVGVEKLYRTSRIETVALSGIDLEVPRGAFISIMGPSGSGKSTLLNLMGLLDTPTGGRIELAGRALTGLGDAALARTRNDAIGFIFQSFHLVSDLSARDNVEIPLLYRRMSDKDRHVRARAALERVGLGARMDHFPAQLSGGQQQRVAIARAIVGGPELILADEPTGNLDSQMGGEIMALLEELNRAGATIVMVTHDPGLAERTGRTIRLFDGRQVR